MRRPDVAFKAMGDDRARFHLPSRTWTVAASSEHAQRRARSWRSVGR
ncbi:hypothetical protein [Streptomyces sp. NPDC048825]